MKSYSKRFFSFILLLSFMLAAVPALAQFAERPRNDEITSILTKFKNYRFGAVNLYEILDPNELKDAIKAKAQQVEGAVAGEECAQRLEEAVRQIVQFGVEEGQTMDMIIQTIIMQGYSPPERSDLQCAYEYYQLLLIGGTETVTHAYVVTTKPRVMGAIPDTLIGLIIVENEFVEDTQELKPNLETVSEQQIYSINSMRDIPLDENKFGHDNLYSLVMASFIQNNVENKTLEARGIGTDIRYFVEAPGHAEPLIQGDIVGNDDIQRFIRVSKGQPIDYYQNNNILTISPDLIRYERYEMQYLTDTRGAIRTDTLGNPLLNPNFSVNNFLPKIGAELKYGLEDINYPSFWSNRLTLSALWKNVTLGLVMPTPGWSSLSSSVFKVDRTLTTAGVGIAGQLDFPIALIPGTGVFKLSGSYVFGDADPLEEFDVTEIGANTGINLTDYLIRSHAQMHYTFGIAIDKDYMMRFGVGGTFYAVEAWQHELGEDEDRNPFVDYVIHDEDAIGGISGKIDFMATNQTTPFGGSVQYFDESLYANIWLQIPVVDQRFSIRLDANGYFVAFRDNLHAWEESRSIFIPMARFILAF